jgi:hypothetical protein
MFIVLPASVTNVMGAWVLAKRMRLLGEARGLMTVPDAIGARYRSPAADPDLGRPGSDVSDHDGGRRTGDADHVVMLRQPEAAIAEPLHVARHVKGVAQRVDRAGALGDESKIEDRKR